MTWEIHSKGRGGATAMYHAYSEETVIFINKLGAILFTPKAVDVLGNPTHLQIAHDDSRIAFIPAKETTLNAYKVVKENAGSKTVSRITCMSFVKTMGIKPDKISIYDEVYMDDGVLVVELASRKDL